MYVYSDHPLNHQHQDLSDLFLDRTQSLFCEHPNYPATTLNPHEAEQKSTKIFLLRFLLTGWLSSYLFILFSLEKPTKTLIKRFEIVSNTRK
jgi:hypothetical protein